MRRSIFLVVLALLAGCGSNVTTPSTEKPRFTEFFYQKIGGRKPGQANAKYLVSVLPYPFEEFRTKAPLTKSADLYASFALSLFASGAYRLVYSTSRYDLDAKKWDPDQTRVLKGRWHYRATGIILEKTGTLEYAIVKGEAGAVLHLTGNFEPATLAAGAANVPLAYQEGKDGNPPPTPKTPLP